MPRKTGQSDLSTVDWRGASGRLYHYWVYPLPAEFDSGQTGNFIFARLDAGGRWVPLYIGQGDLHAVANRPPAQACLEAGGATHLHANQGGHTQVRLDEARDLLEAHPEAVWPRGCTPPPPRQGG